MKGALVLCEELRALDGVLGAFVLESNECVASSISPEIDATQIDELTKVLARAQQVVKIGGYDGAALAFHWEKGSLLTWVYETSHLLGLFATPNAIREILEDHAANVLKELAELATRHTFPPDEVPTRRDHVIPRP
jgi:hypothetical protein